jgi:hypothetical protein
MRKQHWGRDRLARDLSILVGAIMDGYMGKFRSFPENPTISTCISRSILLWRSEFCRRLSSLHEQKGRMKWAHPLLGPSWRVDPQRPLWAAKIWT